VDVGGVRRYDKKRWYRVPEKSKPFRQEGFLQYYCRLFY
jgi:hypothetical protein